MRVLEQFDRVRIVNLASRKDRRREMDRELAKVGLAGDPRVSYFPAFRPDDAGQFTSIGARGVYESQKAILREAAAAGESVLILEDDCDFRPGASDQEAVPGWDIFYGGYTAANPEDLATSDIQDAHMMGFSRDGAQQVSAYLEALRYDGIHPPIDAAYVWFRRAYPDVETRFAIPPMAVQRPSRSDIATLAWFDKLPLVRQLASLQRSVRKRFTRLKGAA
ncbi:hypothetical protein [Novosphingopyxis baekryungensis]|uniref:hypothetical protein n=1 Tax=Novosphingopyxis baekryungensis TaxID=279369 RepID=UPI0012EBB021|nr:hypothetical protein [Novosphingopyxis baekryungensis]